jgi:hypothetical protein
LGIEPANAQNRAGHARQAAGLIQIESQKRAETIASARVVTATSIGVLEPFDCWLLA